MEQISEHVFIETEYPGVVSGVINLESGLLLIDAPFDQVHQQAWRSRWLDWHGQKEILLVLSDTHLDRTIGISTIEPKIIAHENAVEILRNRSTSGKSQDIDAGAEWPAGDLPANLRWVSPDIIFSNTISLHWGKTPIRISHQPGSHSAGCWVHFDADKVIFVGDSIVGNQPPFLAWSDIETWIEEMKCLMSDQLKGYKIISGRSGVVKTKSIEKMISFLSAVKVVIEELLGSRQNGEGLDSLVNKLMKKLTYDKDFRDVYMHRLRWGLTQYMRRQEKK